MTVICVCVCVFPFSSFEDVFFYFVCSTACCLAAYLREVFDPERMLCAITADGMVEWGSLHTIISLFSQSSGYLFASPWDKEMRTGLRVYRVYIQHLQGRVYIRLSMFKFFFSPKIVFICSLIHWAFLWKVMEPLLKYPMITISSHMAKCFTPSFDFPFYELTVKQDHPYHGHKMPWAHCRFQGVSQSKKEQILICHLLKRNLATIKESKSKPCIRLQKL